MTIKRKRFGVSHAINRGLSETIQIGEGGAGLFRNTIIPLSRIELDPENPRKLAITIADLAEGPQQNDPQYEKKKSEFESLQALARTINHKGLIQPIAVYKHDDKYRVVAGNRRSLAAIIAGKSEIEARVLQEKPTRYEMKLLQLIENTAREDLTLYERVENVREIAEEYKREQNDVFTPQQLKEIAGYSETIAKNYLYIINAPTDVWEAVKTGRIKNLESAALIANMASDQERAAAIEACGEGVSLKSLRKIVSTEKENKRGRAVIKVNLGTTKKTAVVKTIVDAILLQPKFQNLTSQFKLINWQDHRQSALAFKNLIQILEKELAG